MIPTYPLAWPAGWKRTPAHRRKAAKFRSTSRRSSLSPFDGVSRVLEELERMAVGRDDIVVSTNLPTRLDGLPRSDAREPDDSGAAVYWRTKSGELKCMAIDRYSRVADNLAAIAATLEALRAIERHGGGEILDRAFTGFTALPEPPNDWRRVLGVPANATLAQARDAYMRARSVAHPDRGGNAEAFGAVERAWAAAQQETPA